MSEILERMRKDMFKAVKDHDQVISGIIQLAIASVKNFEISKGEDVSEEEIIEVLRKESKKLQDSIDQFTSAGRTDLVDSTRIQLEYIKQYLPQMMTLEEIEGFVDSTIKEMGEVSMKDMGRVMGAVMGKLQGKAEGNAVKDIVIKKLS